MAIDLSGSDGVIIISGSSLTTSGSEGETTYSQTGTEGTSWCSNIQPLTASYTLLASDSGKTFAIDPDDAAITASLPTPTASIEGCCYTFVVSGPEGLGHEVMLSASKDPLTLNAPGAFNTKTGSFIGQVYSAAGAFDGKTHIEAQHGGDVFNLLHDTLTESGADELLLFDSSETGDQYFIQCMKFSPFDDDDENACAWMVHGHCATGSAFSASVLY